MFDSYKKKIVTFYKRNRRMPSYTEIMKLVGFKSKNAVSKLVDKLVEAGVVTKDSDGKLIPQNIYGEVKYLSQTVSAGYGSAVEEEMMESLNLNEWLVGDESKTYMVDVQGDSMKDAGIFDGDTVLVERTTDFHNGDIVVALMNDGYTIKYLRKQHNTMHLDPANRSYKPIYPTEENQIELIAVVKTIIRKL
jgi:repressor LexA